MPSFWATRSSTLSTAKAEIGEPGAREAAGLELELALGGDDLAVLGGADLDPHRRARGRAGRLEGVLAAHHQLDGQAGLLRQQGCDRLEIDHRLAAEAAADLGRIDAQIADAHLEQAGGVVADD